MNDLKNTLGSNYDLSTLATEAEALKVQLAKTGIVMMPNFLSSKGLQSLQDECLNCKNQAYQSQSSYNVYIKPDDPNFDINSARNRRFKTSKKCVPDDLIPSSSVLRTIYDSPELRAFFATVVGADQLYPYADNLSSININYYSPGDALEWHFDNADFTITLLAQACAEGGVYEYCTDMRYDKNGNENYDLVEKILDERIETQKEFVNAGDLMIFRGNKSLHRVTPILKGERILITLNFNTAPNISLSEESRKTFFGRTK